MADQEDMSRYIEIARSCACGNLRRASRVITQAYDRFLQPSGLKVTQFIMLMALKMLGPITISKLAEKMLMDRTTCTRNLKGLQEKALISFEQAEDRRMKKVVLTDQGNEMLEKSIPLWEKAQGFILNEVGKQRMTHLLKDLSEMVSVIRKA
ncbi:MAG: MarR family transcriptional regulator [Desulfobacteraceae bacterium]|nr:MAG: MarR family transcriptional regulator [Desulfobacteraceae bacterium]